VRRPPEKLEFVGIALISEHLRLSRPALQKPISAIELALQDGLFVLTAVARVRSTIFSRCTGLIALSLSRRRSGGCMQRTCEVISTFSFEHPQVKFVIEPARPRPHAVATAGPGVLLVGRSTPWLSALCVAIEQCGAEPVIVSPLGVTSESVKESGHVLVLLGSCVRPEKRRQLVGELRGSDVSLFYAFPVETGCWWLPALRHGQDCHGEAGFRASEFLVELRTMLLEISRRSVRC
jgi:hypothetical protein